MKRLKVWFDRHVRRAVEFNTDTFWRAPAALAWLGYLCGPLVVACVLTALVFYLRFGLSRDSQR